MDVTCREGGSLKILCPLQPRSLSSEIFRPQSRKFRRRNRELCLKLSHNPGRPSERSLIHTLSTNTHKQITMMDRNETNAHAVFNHHKAPESVVAFHLYSLYSVHNNPVY